MKQQSTVKTTVAQSYYHPQFGLVYLLTIIPHGSPKNGTKETEIYFTHYELIELGQQIADALPKPVDPDAR